eukprot:11646247-Ditylum_brightwellii.AAC.1
MEELAGVFSLHLPQPEVHCKVFKDNQSCIVIAKSYKFSPCTKHIALKYHHFRKLVQDGKMVILPITSAEQTADIFTMLLHDQLFEYLHKKLIG